MKTNYSKSFTILALILLAKPLFAEGLPAEAIYLAGFGALIIALVIAFSIAFVFNKVLQYTRKEERTHIWFMAIGTLIFPLTYMLLEEQFHLVGRLEFVFGYNGFALANSLIVVALIFSGFHAGYFATVVRKSPEPRNKVQKRKAVKIQTFAWLLVAIIFVLMAMKDQLQELKRTNDQEKLTEKRTSVAMDLISGRLHKGFDQVQWNESDNTFSARTKKGLQVNLRYDRPSDYYYLSFQVNQGPAISDTLVWLDKINIVKPLLSDVEYKDLMETVDRHELRINESETENYYDISFSTANLAIVHYRATNRMEILWVAATVVP